MTEELVTRMGGDSQEPHMRLLAAVALAAFSTAVSAWCTSGGRADLHALVDDALGAVGDGFDDPRPSEPRAPDRRPAAYD